jgi:CRISPR-associated protein Cas5h
MEKIISFDIKADFGFLKKPDTNEPIYITYNMLHKPALLGILGAIIGLKGFKIILETNRNKKREYVPEYYEKLKGLPIGIQPLKDENGNFAKTVIRYNNSVGYANKDGGTLLIDEQTLIKPSYRCFILLNLENELQNKLYRNIKNCEAEYLPYLGKNDFSIWWENFQDYGVPKRFDYSSNFKIVSLIQKTEALTKGVAQAMGRAARQQTKIQFMYFERLPIAYRLDLRQYEMANFAYSNAILEKDYSLENLYQIGENENVQLF